ncbi:MAG: hypothetical protein R3272_08390 [Candidatus Promineifilaceae bacterium]|nr:hypothetical protein [Candidatus Promineifilaceae bacterium]
MRRLPALRYIRRRHLLVAAVGVAAVLLYVALSSLAGGPGFPLDDGWIHQTYARNLAAVGRWEYTGGETSAGSTAPLWTVLLAVGYLLQLPHLPWAYLLGALSLVALLWSGMMLWRALWPQWAERDWLVGLFLALTWPLVWAAVSGMETLLFTALGLMLLWLYSRAGKTPLWLSGLLAGLLVMIRPEGLLLLVLIALALAVRGARRSLLLFLSVAALLLLPYFALNLSLGGALWPSTLYAKQAEYGQILTRPLPIRYLNLFYFSAGGPPVGWRGISGAHLLLLPGLLFAAVWAVREDWRHRRLRATLPLLWAAGHIFAYAWRLPVTYQHGRYLLPALPVWVLYGLAGWSQLAARWPHSRGAARLLTRVGKLVLAVLLLLFFLLGAQAYVTDVAFIQSEMVDVALWLRAHTPPEALVATHDIGAIGYFARRPLLDLAGLITPEVVPFLGNEAALADYVRRSGADYLVTAPGWPYPLLTGAADTTLLYETDFPWTEAQGWNNMAVYRLPSRPFSTP